MNKNKKWLLAASIAAMFGVNGLVMAATPAEQAPDHMRRTECFEMERSGMRANPMHGEFTSMLKVLKIDGQSFKAQMREGKTLLEIAKGQGVSEKTLRKHIGERMEKHITQGVSAGKISDERAKTMRANMDDNISKIINSKGWGQKHRPGTGAMVNHDQLSAFLNTDADTLKAEIKKGKTLAAIATDRGISEQQLKSFMTEQMTERLDAAVAAGRLNNEQAAAMKQNMEQRIQAVINGTAPMHKQGARMHRHSVTNNQQLLSLLRTDAETLKGELQSGKTLAQFAGEQGISVQQLKQLLTDQAVQRIDDNVKNGCLDADRAQAMKDKVEQRVERTINSKHTKEGWQGKDDKRHQLETVIF